VIWLIRWLKSEPFWHHLLVAWTITAAVYLATNAGWMSYIDGVTLTLAEWRLASPDSHSCNHPDSASTEQNSTHNRVVVEISPDDYAGDDFKAKSPLDRKTLSDYIRTLVTPASGLAPQAIAIDIDISPGTSWESATDVLDQAIDYAKSQGVKIFLIAPILEAREEDLALRQQWLQNMCNAGATFGFSDGVFLRHRKEFHSLGMVVRTWEQESKFKPATSDSHDWICKQLKDAKDNTVLPRLQQLAWQDAKRKTSVPINLWTKVDCWEMGTLLKQSTPVIAKIKNNSVVFLGGSYDPKDIFITAIGKATGVRIHAAISISNIDYDHWKAYLVELVIGIVLGYLLSLFVNLYYRSRSVYDHSVLHGRIFGRQLLRTFVFYWTPFGLCALAFIIVMISSEKSLANGSWLNPAPMIIGIFIDSIVAHTTRHNDSVHVNRAKTKPRGLKVMLRVLSLHPGLFWKILLIMWSLVHLAGNH
jgi:hypothetical protein